LTPAGAALNLYSILYALGVTDMAFFVRDIVPLSQARATLSELADEARSGAEKVITKNGESYVALINADKLAYYHQLEREHLHLLLLEDARQGIAEMEAGLEQDADAAIAKLQRRRKSAVRRDE
jgi:prevent-host-death family protein